MGCYKQHKEDCAKQQPVKREEKHETINNEISTKAELTQEQEDILASEELREMLREDAVKAKIRAILVSADPLNSLRAAMLDDPEGIGRVASIIYRIMDDNKQESS